MKRFGAVGGALVIVIVVLAALQFLGGSGDPSSSGPAGGPGMEHESAEMLAQRILKRFEDSLELDRLSVDVVGAASRTEATLVFDYYTPLGDKSFRLPIAYRERKWVAAEKDILTIEKRFER